MKYWLLKSEPDVFSLDDLKKSDKQRATWEGVRNYQARNFMKEMRKGDLAFFYHSRINPPLIVGTVRIEKEAYPDPTQFDPQNEYYDPKSRPDDPRWVMVEVEFDSEFKKPISRDELKKIPALNDMLLFRNSRLSVMQILKTEWDLICRLGE